MSLQQLISKIEDNLIDTLTQVDGIDESFFPNIEDIRDNLRQQLEVAATEVVQDGINENVNVSRFVRNFQIRATTLIRTQLLRQPTNQRLSITYEQISESVNRAIESVAGDGNLANLINNMREEIFSEGVIQPSDIDTSETTPSTVGEARRATQTFDEVLDDFIKKATEVGEEKVVDLLEAFKNDSGIKELVGDNSLRIEDLNNFLIEIDVYKSQLYGEDMKIRAGITKTFDDEFVGVLQKYAKDKGMVLELFIERGFDSVHNEGSIIDRNSLSPNYKANQSNRNFTKKIYFPEKQMM